MVDTDGIGVTGVVTSLAFIDRTDEGIVITSKPQSPLSSVGWSALSVNVIGQSFNTVEKILGRFNVVKVDEMTWDSTGGGITFGTISLGRWSWVVSLKIEFKIWPISDAYGDEMVNLGVQFGKKLTEADWNFLSKIFPCEKRSFNKSANCWNASFFLQNLTPAEIRSL